MYGSGLLTRYVAREFLLAFVVAFLFFFSIFFINVLLVTATDIIAKQVPAGEVARLVVYSLPQIVHLAFPFATLLAALMALARLNSDLELVALQLCGIRLLRGLAPLMVIGTLLALLSFATNDVLLPASTIEFNRVYRRILSSYPGLELEPNAVKHFADSAIVTGDLQGDRLQDVAIIDRNAAGERRVITARTLRLHESVQQAGVISLLLSDVFTHSADTEVGNFEYVRAGSMEYHIVLPDIVEALVEIGPGEQSSVDLWQAITERRMQQERRRLDREFGDLTEQLDVEADYELRNYLFEFHKKVAVPAACLVFALFAVPAGLLAPRSGRAYGLLVGMAMAVVYWSLLVSAHGGGLRHQFSPALAIWTPNLVVLALAGGLYVLWRLRCGSSA